MRKQQLGIALALLMLSVRPGAGQVDSLANAARLQALVVKDIHIPRRDVVCVGVTQDLVPGAADPRQMLDPDSALLSELAWLKNLRVSSACELVPDAHQAMYARADHKPAVHVGIAAPRIWDAQHATIDVQAFSGGLEGEADRCELVQEGRGWRVASCKTIGRY